MKTNKFIFKSWSSYKDYIKFSVLTLIRGLIKTCIGLIAGVTSLLNYLWNKVCEFARIAPKPFVLTIFTIVSLTVLFMYASFKTKLTTVIWQRDSLRLKIDSVYQENGYFEGYNDGVKERQSKCYTFKYTD